MPNKSRKLTEAKPIVETDEKPAKPEEPVLSPSEFLEQARSRFNERQKLKGGVREALEPVDIIYEIAMDPMVEPRDRANAAKMLMDKQRPTPKSVDVGVDGGGGRGKQVKITIKKDW